MLLDPEFGRDARQWFDAIFGRLAASEHADKTNPQSVSALRQEYLRLLTLIETQVRMVTTPTAAPAHKSIRRRIFEWLERGYPAKLRRL
jgi:hypothetical protein